MSGTRRRGRVGPGDRWATVCGPPGVASSLFRAGGSKRGKAADASQKGQIEWATKSQRQAAGRITSQGPTSRGEQLTNIGATAPQSEAPASMGRLSNSRVNPALARNLYYRKLLNIKPIAKLPTLTQDASPSHRHPGPSPHRRWCTVRRLTSGDGRPPANLLSHASKQQGKVVVSRLWQASVAALALTLPGLAAAQDSAAVQPAPAPSPATAATSRTTSYDAAFFAPFAPRSALDIARRVPGFSLDLGNSDIRGFAAAAGNVVINGSRPSSKAESLETTLLRIPARRVLRVEVGPGDLFGADYSSKSQVLNIIMSARAGLTGTSPLVRRCRIGTLSPDGSASVLIRRGASTINLSAGSATSSTRRKAPTRSPIRTAASFSNSGASITATTTSTPICRRVGRSSTQPTERSGSTPAGRLDSSTSSSATA